MKSLTHGQFIEKLEHYAPILRRHKEGATWADLAKEFDLSNPAHASNVVRFCNRHAAMPRLDALNGLTNTSVMAALKAIPFSTIEGLRAILIQQYSASLGTCRQKPKAPKRAVKVMMVASGLEWFEKDGRLFIHWKHDKEIAA